MKKLLATLLLVLTVNTGTCFLIGEVMAVVFGPYILGMVFTKIMDCVLPETYVDHFLTWVGGILIVISVSAAGGIVVCLFTAILPWWIRSNKSWAKRISK